MDSSSATDEDGWHIMRVAETGSTNDDLVAAARAGAPSKSALVAGHQTAGRGRLGRTWEAPPGASLLVSVLVRPGSAAADRIHGATQAVGLAARAACAEVGGFTPELKWPNDLLVGERKLAGVLAEAVYDGSRMTAVVIGMGLNVAWPTEPTAVAISASHAAGMPIDRETILAAFLRHLGAYLNRWEHDPDTLLADYRAALGTLGRTVRVETPSELVEGTATDVTDDGHLVVVSNGERVEIGVGDVVHVRNA